MHIDWTIIPAHNIEVGKLTDPYDICHLLKQHKIDKYVYRIMFKGIVLKYGMSADKSKNFGERLYRQIAHAESWGDRRISGSSGADWRIIEEEFFSLYGIKIDKKGLKIKIWNFTDYPFTTINPRDEVFYAEQELIESYVNLVGEKPIGNLHDDDNYKRRGHIKKDLFGNNGLFDEE